MKCCQGGNRVQKLKVGETIYMLIPGNNILSSCILTVCMFMVQGIISSQHKITEASELKWTLTGPPQCKVSSISFRCT